MKNYILWSFKKRLPFYIITFILFLTIALVEGLNVSFLKTVYNNPSYSVYQRSDAGFLGLLIALFLLITALPLYNMNYRYSLAKSDTFRQAPIKKRYFRYVDNLIPLAMVLLLFTISFLTLFVILFIRNGNTVVPEVDSSRPFHYELLHYNFIYYLPLYFSAILLAIGQYLISYLLVSRSNNRLNSVLMLILGQLFLGGLFVIPVLFINGKMGYTTGFFNFRNNGSLVYPIDLLKGVFNDLITVGENSLEFSFNSQLEASIAIVFIATSVVYASLMFVGLSAFIFENDPSSEWANKPASKDLYQEVLFHLFSGIIGIYLGMITKNLGISAVIILSVLFVALYYTLYGLLNRNFKLNLKQFITFGSVSILAVSISLIYFFAFQ